MVTRGLGPHRRASMGPSNPTAACADENAPPEGFDALPFTFGAKGPSAASRHSFHFGATRPPLASVSSSMYNRKAQVLALVPKNGSRVVRAVGKVPARRSVARTSFAPPTKRLRRSSAEILLSKCVSLTPANLEGCPDEAFLSLELEWEGGIHKTILVEELKSCVEACRQKETIIHTLECDLSELIQESNELEKTNVKSLELLEERDMEIQRLNSELEKANINRKYQQEKDDVSRQAEFHREVIASLATEQVSIKEQLASSKNNELLAKANLGEIELLLDESIEAIVQKEVIAQNYASLVMDMKEEIHRLESQLEQSKRSYKGIAKEPEIRMQEMNDQVAASLISRNKEEKKREAHAEEKNEILKKNKMLEISIEDFKDTVYSLEERVYSLEKKANKFKEEAQLQRRQREKLEVELHILRQQSPVVQSFGKAESSLKDGMSDLADSTRAPNYRNNELLCSQESRRICRKEVSDKESVVVELLDGEMAQPHLSHEKFQLESSPFEHPSPAEQPELYRNGADSDQAPAESESVEQGPPEALKAIIEVVEEKELPPVAAVQDRKPLDYALAPSDELKKLRTINHYEGQRTATDRRFWSIEQQDLYTSIYKSAKIFEMKWIDWEHIRSVDQFAGIRERCAFLGLDQIMSYACAWDNELIRQFYSTVHISTDKSSITWMTNGRKITTNKRAWEETLGIPGGVHSEIHSQFWLDDDEKRILYTTADCQPGQISGLSPLTVIAKKIVWSTIYPRSGNAIDGHNWNLLFHIVKQHPFDIISLLLGEIDLIISGRNGTKDVLLYAPYIMGMIMRAFEYDGPRDSRHNSYKPRPSYNYKQKRRNRCSCPPAPAAAAPFEPPSSAFQPEIVVDVDADNQQQFDADGHQPQGEAVHGQTELTATQTDLQVVRLGLRPIRHSLTDVSTQPAIVRPSPFGRFPWYQREK